MVLHYSDVTHVHYSKRSQLIRMVFDSSPSFSYQHSHMLLILLIILSLLRDQPIMSLLRDQPIWTQMCSRQ